MFTHPSTYPNPKQNPCLDLHAKNDEVKQRLKMAIWVFFPIFYYQKFDDFFQKLGKIN
jgi:hypothetical protein